MSDWQRIFKAGTHTDSSGFTRAFTVGDLDKAVASFQPGEHEPPLVAGHPAMDAPAYGWVSDLRRSGDVLEAKFDKVADEVRSLVADGRYRKVSAAFYPDMRLRHVGLLGASVPAIKGLGSFSFGEGDFAEYEFATGPSADDGLQPPEETMKSEELEKQLREKDEELKKAQQALADAKAETAKVAGEFAEYRGEQERKAREFRLGKLIEDGKLLPAERDRLLTFAETLAKAEKTMEYTEGQGQVTQEEAFWKSLEDRPAHNLFAEQATKGSADNGKDGGVSTVVPVDTYSKV